MLPHRVRVDQEAMVMKVYSIFHRALYSKSSSSDCLMSYQGYPLGKSYPTAGMQWVYSTAQAEWAEKLIWFQVTNNNS